MEQFIVALKELLPTGRKRTLGAIVFYETERTKIRLYN